MPHNRLANATPLAPLEIASVSIGTTTPPIFYTPARMSTLTTRFPTLLLHPSLTPSTKRVPQLYMGLAMLLAFRFPPSSLGQISAPPPLSAPSFQSVHAPSGTGPYARAIFNPSHHPRRHPLSHTLCSGCGRPALSSAPERHWYCSSLCALACHLFISDLLAVAMRPLYRPPMGPAPQLRYIHPAYLPAYERQQRSQYGHLLNRAIVINDEWALAYASSLYPHPISLRRCLKRHFTLWHRLPAKEKNMADPKSPASAGSADLISLASLQNPVVRRSAEIVLKHLETADAFLANTSAPPTPSKLPKKDPAFAEAELPPTSTGVIWNKQQVALFLGLLNRTIPSISASINLSAAADNKDPSEMSREELEAAARRAKIIDIPKDKANDPQPEQQEPL